MEQERAWDVIAKKWNSVRDVPKPAVKEFLKGKKGKVLDIGCGSGRHFVDSNNFEFYGIDFSKEMVKLAKKKSIAKEVKIGNAWDIDFKDDFFDYVIFAAALHCIEDEDKRRRAVEEMFRVLKKGGEGIITVLSKSHKRVKGKECFIPWTVGSEKIERYYYVYDADEIRKLVEDTGFEILSLVEDKMNISLIIRKN